MTGEPRDEKSRHDSEEKQRAIKQAVDECSDEAWQEVLGAAPEQWKALKPLLERIRGLKEPLSADVSIYWIAGSTRYEEQSLVESSEGARSLAKASGWFSVTSGAGSTSESYTGSGADGQDRLPSFEGGHSSSSYQLLTSGQYPATSRTGTTPEDSNRPAAGGEARHTGREHPRAVAGGAIQYSMQIPGPVKKTVGDIALGWQWERPSLAKDPNALSESERVCEQLIEVFEANEPDLAQVHQRVEALRQARVQRQAQLREAQQQLRAIITPQQEAKLVLMGYLE